jgi:hypothetical protein
MALWRRAVKVFVTFTACCTFKKNGKADKKLKQL